MLQNIFLPHHSIEMNFSSISLLGRSSYGRNFSHIFDRTQLSLETLVISRYYLVGATQWLPWSCWDRLWLLVLILYGQDSPLLFQNFILTFLHKIDVLQRWWVLDLGVGDSLSKFFYIWGYDQKILIQTFTNMFGRIHSLWLET